LYLSFFYQQAAPKESKPVSASGKPAEVAPASSKGDASGLNEQIKAQGDKVRDLKTKKADKVPIVYTSEM
jgi:hypothetical protein